MPFRMPFAGESEIPSPDSILSHSYGALLPMFTTKEATTLRQLCREFKTTVADFPWDDRCTVIPGSVAAWRACFPRAKCALVKQFVEGKELEEGEPPGRKIPLVDADFVHFQGLSSLNMEGCTGITDAAFAHLHGICALFMGGCTQPTITDVAFSHLKGIHLLSMPGCSQPTITDAAFSHLRGIFCLDMSKCSQFTDVAFTHLKGIHTLDMSECNQPQITDAAFASLGSVHVLTMNGCDQSTITDLAFTHLHDIRSLGVYGCTQATITPHAFAFASVKGCSLYISGGQLDTMLQGGLVDKELVDSVRASFGLPPSGEYFDDDDESGYDDDDFGSEGDE